MIDKPKIAERLPTAGAIVGLGFLLIGCFGSALFSQPAARTEVDWPVDRGEPGNSHYSSLSQINRENVKNLQVAWTYDSGESGGLETSPLIIDGVLYGYTPNHEVFALDAATGKLLWKFDSGVQGKQPIRGLAMWTKGRQRRLISGIMNYVYELDPRTGKKIDSFGNDGRIDLHENLGRDPKTVVFDMTSPAAIYKDLIIVGGREPEALPCAPGDIRAYGVRTGKLRWTFHTIPRPGEFGYETWPPDAWKYTGAANNWAGMAVDVKRGIVYVPTGSAATDFYGADRRGDDLFANCLIALDAATGKRLWHFQGVKHDLWDRDFPAPPVLVTVERDGKQVDAVAQTSKQGFLYLFNRATGETLFPIGSRAVPPSKVEGEVAASTQALPTRPAPFARQLLTEGMLTHRTPEAHERALEKFRTMRSEGQFVPFSVGKDTVMMPGFDGGAEWGGPAVDPETKILYVNANDVVKTGALRLNNGVSTRGESLYRNQCAMCHREDRSGSPPDFPSLMGVGNRMSQQEIANTIRQGRGRMPAYTNLSDLNVKALVHFLVGIEDKEDVKGGEEGTAPKYIFTGYGNFLDSGGYPAVDPPWGTLSAINLDTGEYVWKVPLGQYPELAAEGLTNTGSENYGGPVVTAGGLVFIGATIFDKKFRAFDKATGELRWETTLPFPGNATPATYEVKGRQYVVIAAGGGKDIRSPSGGVYVAFALPQ